MKGANKRARAALLIVSVLIAGCGGSAVQSGGGGSNVPTISNVNPSTVTSSALPRTITVNGTGFQSGLTVTITTSSSSTHPAPSQITSTSFQITAIFNTGSYTISVTDPGGQASSPFAFTVKTALGINFAPQVNYATGATSSGPGGGSGSIELADFSGDGKLDIAVSNYASNTIAVFLNKGDGSFGPPLLTTVDSQGALGLGAIVSGDFNEDGQPDLIVATTAGSQSDLVLLGNGDGTFTQGSPIPNSFGFIQARAVDLNGDKHLDLIVGNNGNMSVALGNGDGTFNPADPVSTGPLFNTYPGMDVGDLTGNGDLDFVGADFGPSAGDIVVFPGNGDGTFQTPTWQSPAPMVPDSIALADFNDDGKLDALIGYPFGTSPPSVGSAEVALGNGNGTFNLTSQLPIYTSSLESSGITVQTADLDQDGRPDALVTDYSTGVFTVVLNNASSIANGTSYSYTTAPGSLEIAAGDLNGDGMPDVVLVNDETNQLSVFLSQSQ